MIERAAWSTLLVSLFCLAAAPTATPALAQFGRRTTEPGVVNVFLPAPRESRQRLTQAREALDDQRYSDAVDNLDKLLRDPEGEDYFSGPSAEEKPQQSIKGEALRLLGGMPKKGREVYELSYGAEARKLLDEAVAEGDLAKLTEVTRMFFHTKAGYEATLLLGRYQLDRGRPLAGALGLSRMAESSIALDEFDPELSLLLATCWLQANNPAKAEETLVSLKNRKPGGTVRIGEQQVKLFDESHEALAWLEKTIGQRQLLGPREASQWVVFRGDSSRNAASSGSSPLLSFRWRIPCVNDPEEEKLVAQVTRKIRDQNWPALPGLHPLVVRDVVIVRSGDKVMGVNFNTGKRMWESLLMSETTGSGLSSLLGPPARSTPLRETEIGQRLFEDSPYGQLSSDGETVFALQGLGYAYYSQYSGRAGPVLIGPRGQRIPNTKGVQQFNTLIALSIKSEGKVMWEVGGEDGEQEPRLAGSFFLAPPLPLHGSLYALAEINSEIRLVVLNAKTGALEWSQQIAHVDNRTILFDVTRRLAGATPSYADGILICPTSAGAVVAVDISSRSLLWGYQYEQNRQVMNQFLINGTQSQQRGVGNRWADASASIAEGRVLLTPIESEKMYCLDLATGKLLWPAQKRVDGGLEHFYVAGVKDGRAVLVGRGKVSAIKLSDGTPAWSKPVELSALPSGRGFMSDRYYYVPTADSKLSKIDVIEGKLTQQTATGQVLGNLVCYKDQIVSQGVDWLFTFYQNEPLRALIAKRIVDNPDDGWALARQAEIHLQDGKATEAIALLRRAHKLKIPGEADAIRALLVSTLLTALREDFAANQAVAAEIDELVEQPAQRAELRRLMALGLLKTGKVEEAFEAFVKLSGVDDGVPAKPESAGDNLEQVEPGLAVRRDRWVQAQLARLLSTGDESQRAKMDQAVTSRLQAALKADSPVALRQFLNYFGSHPLGDQARLALARRLIDRDDLLEAEWFLSRVEQSPDAVLATAAAREMTRLLEKAGLAHELAQPRTWLSGKSDVTESPEPPGVVATSRRAASVVRLRDARGLTGGGLMAYDTALNSLIFRDALGKERLQVPLTRSDGTRYYYSSYSVLHAKQHAHLTILSIGYEVIAIDSLRTDTSVKDAILWRQDLSPNAVGAPGVATVRSTPSIRTVANPWGEVRYIATDPQGRIAGETGPLTQHGICFQKARELHCVDPLSGEVLWTRGEIEPGSQLFGDDERIFVVPPNLNEALVLSTIDGSLLGKRKVDPSDNRWTTNGGRMLAWSQTDAGPLNPEPRLTLRLVDVWKQTDVWKRDFPLGARGCLVGHNEVAVVQPDGKFSLLSLESETPRIEAKVEPESSLTAIHVLRSRDQYILAASKAIPRSPTERSITQALGGNLAPLILGRVYAFDRATGKPQWQTPAAIEMYGMPLDQPSDVPVLAFVRNISLRPPLVQTAVSQSSILCIDRRDGRILLAKDDVPQSATGYALVGEPDKQSINVQLPSRSFTIKYTDQPAPPEPPAQTGEASSVAFDVGTDLPGKVTHAMLDIFGRGLSPLPLPAKVKRAVPKIENVDDPFAP